MTDFADSPLQRKWAKLKRNKAALFGGALIVIYVTSALFALGHFVIGFQVHRLAVFFPSLAFGWLRDRTNGLGASIVFHAACNLMVELTVVHYWPS